MKVVVAWASPASQGSIAVELPEGASVADAVAACEGLALAGVAAGTAGYAIFGQTARAATPLRDGDRVEITRPLVVDAKSVRRARARLQGAKPTAGSGKSRRRG